jgi:hypothetical protein
VKRYLSDGLAKMAIALADDGTVADRLGPGGARPGTGTTPLRTPSLPPTAPDPGARPDAKEGDRAHRV